MAGFSTSTLQILFQWILLTVVESVTFASIQPKETLKIREVKKSQWECYDSDPFELLKCVCDIFLLLNICVMLY